MIRIVRAKLHDIQVTKSDLEYHGSITLDPELCDKVGILPLEYVDIWNKHTGARISTYVIFGQAGSGCCVLNGAAARTCQVGDRIVVTASEYVERDQLSLIKPKIIIFGPGNRIDSVLHYDVFKSDDRDNDFRIIEE